MAAKLGLKDLLCKYWCKLRLVMSYRRRLRKWSSNGGGGKNQINHVLFLTTFTFIFVSFALLQITCFDLLLIPPLDCTKQQGSFMPLMWLRARIMFAQTRTSWTRASAIHNLGHHKYSHWLPKEGVS